ncbi:MAG: ABC transporter ATP-binding protein [Candidatus Caenarcaniphilales bacterium]|nr:ABC transporter ATP-binding protein [Candidatus Caenarcaniphilales bacterium]
MKEHIQANNLYLIKQIYPYLQPFRSQITVLILFIPLIAFLQAAQPYLLKKAIDHYTILKSAQINPWIYPILLGVSLILLFSLKTIQNIYVQSIGQKYVASIREKLFKHLQILSIDFFEKNQTGKLLTRLTSDIEALSETFSSGFIGGANDIFSLVGIATFMLFIDWRLTVAQLMLIPILLLLTRIFERYYRKANANSRKELSLLNSLFQESLLGLEVIKIFNRMDKLSRDFAQINKNYIVSVDKLIAADSMFSALIELVGIIGIIVVITTSLLLSFDDVTAGKLVAFVSYSQLLFNPIRNLSEKFSIFQAGFTSAERITALLQETPSIQSNHEENNNQLVLEDTSIKFRSVNFRYKPTSNYVLSNISFNLEEGKSLGIVGQTGSGKSTLIKLLCRFYDPTKGDIYINGKNLKDINPYDLRQNVLMIPQRSFLFSGTIWDNLVLDKKDYPKEKLEEITKETGLNLIIDKFSNGLNTELRERGIDLSSGQRQLISLTRSLIQEPQILILDEATASLDNFTEQLITNAIKKIIHSGRTVIFIAHRLNLVTECDRILVLQNGQIIEQGKHPDLLEAQGYYAKLYEMSEFV